MPRGIEVKTQAGHFVYLDVCYPNSGSYTKGNNHKSKRGRKRDILVYVRNDQDEITQTVRFGKGPGNLPDISTHKLFGSTGAARSAFLKIKPAVIAILKKGGRITQHNLEVKEKR